MADVAAGLLMCRKIDQELEFFLVHPGGPYFVKKNEGWWSIPKGLPEGKEELLETAQREFEEETGIHPEPPFHELGTVKQKGGKIIHAWAFMGAWDPADGIVCNDFEIEWPPRSGQSKKFPEVDKAAWMKFDQAIKMIKDKQIPFLERARMILQQ